MRSTSRPKGTRPAAWVVVVAVLAVAVAAVGVGVGVAGPGARPAGALPLLPGPTVALGDSFTAGEDVSPYRAGTDEPGNRCHRSWLAYPRLAALWRLGSVACGGATTATILETGRYGQPPQLARVPDDAENLVLTVGGNDVGFGDVVRGCVVVDCLGTPLVEQVEGRLAELGARLQEVYSRLLDRAPQADLFVLEYPVLVPDRPLDGCVALPGISEDERRWARELNVAVNDVIRSSVDAVAARHPGRAHLVEVADRFAGHEACGEGLDWILPVPSLHPNHAGHVVMAAALRDEMRAVGAIG